MLISAIKDSFKRNCPRLFKILTGLYSVVSKGFQKVAEFFMILKAPCLQRRALRKLKGKAKLKCVFFVAEVADWKCDRIYQRMLESPRFEAVIVICPVINYGAANKKQEIQECEEFFRKKGYDYIVSLDENTGALLNVKKVVNPDLIFYTDPYRNLTEDAFYISSYQSTLGLYVPYGFNNNSEFNHSYNLLFHNIVWRLYVESKVHKGYAQGVSRCKGRNVVATGYPAIEGLIDGHTPSLDGWKIKGNTIKRIIWAPHHTIEPVGNFAYSCFMDYADFMLEMAEKYKDEVQFVFRPHPHLRKKLDMIWGKGKTDKYYSKWQDGDNTAFVEGAYEDLFLTSDAMIHDSGSFTVEYLFVNKPVMRTINEIPLEKQFNDFTLRCLKNYYLANTQQQVEDFILDVISGRDPLKEQRTAFLNDVLMPSGIPSQNILNDILDSIDQQILYRR